MPLPDLARAYKTAGIDWIAVGDDNYGEGSSRELAAMEPRFMGGRRRAGVSCGVSVESNLKKQGVLTLVFADPADYDRVEAADLVDLVGLEELAPGSVVTVELHHADGSSDAIPATHSLSAEHIEWFEAGSALNVILGVPLTGVFALGRSGVSALGRSGVSALGRSGVSALGRSGVSLRSAAQASLRSAAHEEALPRSGLGGRSARRLRRHAHRRGTATGAPEHDRERRRRNVVGRHVGRVLGGPADKQLFSVRACDDVVLVAAGTMRSEGYGPAILSESMKQARRVARLRCRRSPSCRAALSGSPPSLPRRPSARS